MNGFRKLGPVKRIALVAHDNKKAELLDWVMVNKHQLQHHVLYATGTTGKLVEEALNLPVTKLFSGPLGGDQQIGSMIAQGDLDMMIFFWDPMQAQPHDSDVKALLRLSVAWNIPFACDRATADFILSSPFMQQEYNTTVPDYSGYLQRHIKEDE